MALLLRRGVALTNANQTTILKKIGVQSFLNLETTRGAKGNVGAPTSMLEMKYNRELSKEILAEAKKQKLVFDAFKVDLKKPLPMFEMSEELKTADERIKKILSLEFATTKEYKKAQDEVLRDIFRYHPLQEEDSLEADLALHTLRLSRILKRISIEGCKKGRYHFLIFRLMSRRDQIMKRLRGLDHERYEFARKLLHLQDYEPRDLYQFKRSTRFGQFKLEVIRASRKARFTMMEDLRAQFNREKEAFFAFRDKELTKIQTELKELGYDNLAFPNLSDFGLPLPEKERMEKAKEKKRLALIAKAKKEEQKMLKSTPEAVTVKEIEFKTTTPIPIQLKEEIKIKTPAAAQIIEEEVVVEQKQEEELPKPIKVAEVKKEEATLEAEEENKDIKEETETDSINKKKVGWWKFWGNKDNKEK